MSGCTPPCWTPVSCPECGNRLHPRGRSVPLEMSYTRECCERLHGDPKLNPRHLWTEDDDARAYSDPEWAARINRGRSEDLPDA